MLLPFASTMTCSVNRFRGFEKTVSRFEMGQGFQVSVRECLPAHTSATRCSFATRSGRPYMQYRIGNQGIYSSATGNVSSALWSPCFKPRTTTHDTANVVVHRIHNSPNVFQLLCRMKELLTHDASNKHGNADFSSHPVEVITNLNVWSTLRIGEPFIEDFRNILLILGIAEWLATRVAQSLC